MIWDDAFDILNSLMPGWPDIRYCKYRALFQLAQEVEAGCIVELGTAKGIGAINISLGARVPVYTVDDRLYHVDCINAVYMPDDEGVFMANLSAVSAKVTPIIGNFIEVASTWTEPVGLLVWDVGEGDMLEDVRAWEDHMLLGSIIAVKDNGTGNSGYAKLYDMPGWKKYKNFDSGLVYTVKRESL